MKFRLLVALAALAAWLAGAAALEAHRLDEYLQATRLAIAIDRVDLEIDLTPGAAIAAATFHPIDRDGDQRVSTAEGEAFAREVLRALSITADGQPAAISLVDSRFPDLTEAAAGVGVVRLRAVVHLAAAGSGRHTIAYVNNHRPAASVYLANALVPADTRIAIARQQRDPLQQTLTVDYEVSAGGWSRMWMTAAGFAAIAALVYARRARRQGDATIAVQRTTGPRTGDWRD